MDDSYADDRAAVEEAAQATLRVRLPAEYIHLLRAVGRLEGWVGPGEESFYLVVNTLDDVLSLDDASSMTERFPGAFAFGSDGSRLVFLLDCRESPAPVWMADIVGRGWEDADLQAPDIGTFIGKLMSQGRQALDFGYGPPSA